MALTAIIANGFLWLIADLVNIQVIKQFAVVGMLISGFWVILGNQVTSKILFPLSYLFFMVPIGGDLIAPLMEFTASLSVYLIHLTGIPVFREGLNLSLTSGNWTVAEACSGINYLIASVSLGFVYAYITFSSYWKRALFVLLAFIVPVLANGFRAFLIVMLGHFSNMTLAVGVDHIIYGALFFGLVMMLLFYVSSFWKDPPIYQTQDLSSSQQGTVTAYANQAFFSALFLVVFLNLVWPVGSIWLSKAQQAPENVGLDQKTAFSGKDWQPVQAPQWGWSPYFNGVTADSMVYFSNGQTVFGIYRASFGRESQGGAELVNSQNVLVTPAQHNAWKTVQTSTIQLTEYDGKPLLADQAVLGGIERNLVVLRWYQIGEHNTADPYQAKWLQLIKRLSKDSSPELQVILLIEAPRDDYQQASLVLKEIAQSWLTANRHALYSVRSEDFAR